MSEVNPPVEDDSALPCAEPAGRRGSPMPKYRQILEELRHAIESGALQPGEKIETEAELGKRYGASRITVAKAVSELMKEGRVSRRAGSGTHVLAAKEVRGEVFGLLIPDLGRTEIFEPICQGMMRSPLSRPHSLLWGHAMGESDQQNREAKQLCEQYIRQKVAGVFFAPLEFTPARDVVNREIASALEQAEIPIVLLDRCYAPYPMRSEHDLVGIDNRSAGYQITQHLLNVGARRPAFLARPGAAPTVQGRIAGYRDALYWNGLLTGDDLVRHGDVEDPAFVRGVLDDLRPDSVVCANDLTAGRLILTLNRLGVEVPRELRVVGIDDVKYACMLPVPLTTQHQNCSEIGSVAMATMLQRLGEPSMPVREILLPTRTVVRESCGWKAGPGWAG